MVDAWRKYNILNAVVWEFINTGKPVSSEQLYHRYHFGIKPAMIRNELARLSKEKYLFQPYYSAGRAPTDRGYEFFIDSILKNDNFHNIHLNYSFAKFLKNKDLANLAKIISQKLKLLSLIATLSPKRVVYKEGLRYLIDSLEWWNRNEIKQIIEDFENLEEELDDWPRMFKDHNFIKFFVGRKNPFIHSECLAVAASDYEIGKEKILILAIGPKRMNYKRVYFMLKGLKNFTNKYGRK